MTKLILKYSSFYPMSIFKEFKYKTVLSHCAPQDGKRVATWQPSCQKVFEESGSDRKFLDPSPALFHKQTNPWKRKRNDISIFRKWTYFPSIVS